MMLRQVTNYEYDQMHVTFRFFISQKKNKKIREILLGDFETHATVNKSQIAYMDIVE